VANYIVNGYISTYTGSQYLGFTNLLSILNGLTLDLPNQMSLTMTTAASNILTNNPSQFYVLGYGALEALQAKYTNSSIYTPYAGWDAGYMTRNMDAYLNCPAIKQDFQRLMIASYGIE
jgi:hypothetical protein